MIFIAYNLYKYKLNIQRNIEYREFVLSKIHRDFPNEDYLLPYSQYSKKGLSEKLKCDLSKLTGSFFNDLQFVMSKCNKLVIFPTKSLFIGSGINLEIASAKHFNLPIYCYNESIDKFTKDFIVENSGFVDDYNLYNIFHKKIKFI